MFIYKKIKRLGFYFFVFFIISTPVFLTHTDDFQLKFSQPVLFSGDEPHHFIILYSLLFDGDLDLKNNYYNARKGKNDAGSRFKGKVLDLHVSWYIKDKLYRFKNVYSLNYWERDENGILNPIAQKGKENFIPKLFQPLYSQHPPGLAFYAFPFSWFFKNTKYLESSAILSSTFSVFILFVFFRKLTDQFSEDTKKKDLVSILMITCTPVWVYSNLFFGESILAMLGTVAYTLIFRNKFIIIPGLLFSFSVFIKPVFPLIAIPAFFYFLKEKKVKEAFIFSVIIFIGIIIYLFLNLIHFGSPLNFSQSPNEVLFSKVPINIIKHSIGLDHGLFTYAPIIALSLCGFKNLLLKQNKLIIIIIFATLLYATYFLFFRGDSGYCYGPRFFVPIIPFLCLGLLTINFQSSVIVSRFSINTIIVLSLSINLIAILYTNYFWSKHPLNIL